MEKNWFGKLKMIYSRILALTGLKPFAICFIWFWYGFYSHSLSEFICAVGFELHFALTLLRWATFPSMVWVKYWPSLWCEEISVGSCVQYNKPQLLIILCFLFSAENGCLEETEDGGIVYRLMDFGSARPPNGKLQFVGMTPEYLSTEIAKLVLQLK